MKMLPNLRIWNRLRKEASVTPSVCCRQSSGMAAG